jgi:GT2 family glycosyltransferase
MPPLGVYITSAPSEVRSDTFPNTETRTVQTAEPSDTGIARIDFAHLVGRQFLVYGWIWDFGRSVDSALIYLGDIVIDLVKEAIRVPRPDVTQHFSGGIGHDKHGFYALIDLPENFVPVEQFRLSVTRPSGEILEGSWPVSCDDAIAITALQPSALALKGLMRYLTRREAKRLVEFAAPGLKLEMRGDHSTTLLQPIRFEIEFCGVLEDRILVIFGWLFDPAHELVRAQLRFGASTFDLLESSQWIGRPDITVDSLLYRKSDALRARGFMFVETIVQPETEIADAEFTIASRAETVQLRRQVCCVPHETRQDFLSLLSTIDPNSALMLNEKIAAFLDNSASQRSFYTLLELSHHQTVERLPSSIQQSKPRCSLFIDQVIPVAETGIFLIGWFNAAPDASMRVLCHCGLSSVDVTDRWTRSVRKDVTSYLAQNGIQLTYHEHGYACYVSLRNGSAPYYLSVTSESGEVARMRVTVPEKPESALQTVRALLTSFACEHRDLRTLLDQHVGPAVTAAWVSRHRLVRNPVVRRYGVAPANPAVSIIVPLYGRHDFAEYQMALFAGDPEMGAVELIYVVDDPPIFDEFLNLCPDLYGIYQIPFVVASAGSNLGFAGANNFGAEIARGQHLLLMNSDVVPKRPGWLGELLRTYTSLQEPGLLGTKLLYEDGTVQHAGIAFRRHSPWGGLWINDHPLKGQNPQGLHGVREIDAVTAACALIDAQLYRDLGGCSEDYIIGDFEDSDLCLRANSRGHRNYIALDIELYHLERQSQNRTGDAVWRTNLTAYNCWLHNCRWDDRIQKTSKPPLCPPQTEHDFPVNR